MGNIKDMVNMIPGASKAVGDNEIGEDSFKHIEVDIVDDPKERSNPKIIDMSRKKRISMGSGMMSRNLTDFKAISTNVKNDEIDAKWRVI